MGRVVITHSTYIEGLIPWLRAVASHNAVQTVTPAAIARVRGRSDGLRLRVSVPIHGGFKLMARRGTSAQEVFVVTQLGRDALQSILDQCRPG
ncbi:metal-binding protein [cyanobiont of Ornithocercus magnificus]|nr:metal-binding protein [cyanobiont of Ornithocercus magnificus]